MRVVFCGTGAFGLPALRALRSAGFAIPLVVTQPDRPAGRKRELQASPVKVEALAAGLAVFQPERINRTEALAEISAAAPDVLVVVSYGQILRRAVLDLPPLGCVNIHGSLLPRHRGASPVHAAILAGDTETGVTVMRMDEGLDTGPMLLWASEPVRPDDTTPSLHDRLAELGGRLIVPALRGLADGTLRPIPQDDARATLCRVIEKDAGRIDWTKSADEIERATRAYTPWPGTSGVLLRADGSRLELGIVAAKAVESRGDGAPPGRVVGTEGGALDVATGSGRLRILHVKPAGRGAMDAGAFLRGYRIAVGDGFVAHT